MAKKRLTAAAVEKLKAPEGKGAEIFDAAFPGLSLRITPKGVKSFSLMTRVVGKQRRFSLGRWPQTGLKEARQRAEDLLEEIAIGGDPGSERRSGAAPVNDFAAVVEQWLELDQKKNKSYRDTKSLFEKRINPKFHGKTIQEITKRDINDLLDPIYAKGTVTAARRIHSALHRLFTWASGRGVLQINVMANLPKHGKENPRDRVLSDDELARVWHASFLMGYPFGSIIRLLILTGARRREISMMTWPEFDEANNRILIDGSRIKNGKQRNIPLSELARREVDLIGPVANCDYVFTTNGSAHSCIGGVQKRALDRLVATMTSDGQLSPEENPLAHWRIHDLRRTVATGMQRLGQRQEVTEAVLGHISGSRSGILGVYQQHDWAEEKRAALEAWGRYVELITDPRERVLAAALQMTQITRKKFQIAIVSGDEAWVNYIKVQETINSKSSRQFPITTSCIEYPN